MSIDTHVGHVHFALVRLQRLTKFKLAFALVSFTGRLYGLEGNIIM